MIKQRVQVPNGLVVLDAPLVSVLKKYALDKRLWVCPDRSRGACLIEVRSIDT